MSVSTSTAAISSGPVAAVDERDQCPVQPLDGMVDDPVLLLEPVDDLAKSGVAGTQRREHRAILDGVVVVTSRQYWAQYAPTVQLF